MPCYGVKHSVATGCQWSPD